MPRIYAQVANEDMKELPPYIEECCIEYIPTMGHCLCVRSWLPAGEPLTPSALSVNGLELKVFLNYDVTIYHKGRSTFDRRESFPRVVRHQRERLLQKRRLRRIGRKVRRHWSPSDADGDVHSLGSMEDHRRLSVHVTPRHRTGRAARRVIISSLLLLMLNREMIKFEFLLINLIFIL